MALWDDVLPVLIGSLFRLHKLYCMCKADWQQVCPLGHIRHICRKFLIYTVKKHLPRGICQRKFGRVRGALFRRKNAEIFGWRVLCH